MGGRGELVVLAVTSSSVGAPPGRARNREGRGWAACSRWAQSATPALLVPTLGMMNAAAVGSIAAACAAAVCTRLPPPPRRGKARRPCGSWLATCEMAQAFGERGLAGEGLVRSNTSNAAPGCHYLSAPSVVGPTPSGSVVLPVRPRRAIASSGSVPPQVYDSSGALGGGGLRTLPVRLRALAIFESIAHRQHDELERAAPAPAATYAVTTTHSRNRTGAAHC